VPSSEKDKNTEGGGRGYVGGVEVRVKGDRPIEHGREMTCLAVEKKNTSGGMHT